MLCGTKQFHIVVETEEKETVEKTIIARDQVMARKAARKNFGPQAKIKSCRQFKQFQTS